MRKIFSSLLIIILILLFGATYFCSRKTEEVFKAQAAQVNQNYPGFAQVELLDYQRGLLLSEVKTKIIFQQEVVQLHHQIRHFPWKVQVFTTLEKDSELAAELSDVIPFEQLQLVTEVFFDGSSQSQFHIDELKLSDKKVQLRLQSVDFALELDGRLSDGQLALGLDRLEIAETEETEVVLAGLKMNSNFRDLQGLPLGDGTVQIDNISVKARGKQGFALSGLNYAGNSLLEADTLTSGLNLQLTSLELGGENFSDGQLQMQISGIDAIALKELQGNVRQLQQDMQGQQIDPVILQLQLLGLYSQLFQQGVTLSIDQLAMQADAGRVSGHGAVTLQELNFSGGGLIPLDKLKGDFLLDIDRQFFNAGFRMLDTLQRKGQRRNPAVLNEQAEQIAGGLVQKGIFSRREGGYQLELKLDQGLVELNGNPFRL